MAAARKCLLITRKIIIPPPDSRDPPDGPPVFREKNISPLTAGTRRTSHRILLKKRSPRCQLGPTGSASLLRRKNEYPLLARTHLGGRLTCGPTKLTGTEGFVNLVIMNDSSSSDRSASSTSGLLAPAAPSSAGRAACSCLPWTAVLEGNMP